MRISGMITKQLVAIGGGFSLAAQLRYACLAYLDGSSKPQLDLLGCALTSTLHPYNAPKPIASPTIKRNTYLKARQNPDTQTNTYNT